MPMLVIVFIMVVIVAIAAMQEAGGIEYLVDLTERLLRRYPRLWSSPRRFPPGY